MCLQRHTRRKREAKSQFNDALLYFCWHPAAGRLSVRMGSGAGHVRTIARVRHRGGVRVANCRNCAAPNQPEFCDAGPGPEFRAHVHGTERGCAPEWERCGRGRAGRCRSPECQHVICGYAVGRHLEDDQRRHELDAADRQAGDALDCESCLRSHRSHTQYFDRGHRPHRQRHGLCRRAVLLHGLRRTAKWTSLHPGWRQYLDLVGRGDARRSERSRGCCARQRDVGSHIRNFRISFRQACGGIVSQHRRRRRLHPDLRGGGDRPPEWTSQLARE